jgi:hypothetical protein
LAKQQAPATSPQSGEQEEEGPPAPASAAKVPYTAAVITVNGLCDTAHAAAKPTTAKTAAGNGCKTVITRAQFEKITQSLNPDMSMGVKRQLAQAYPRLLLLAQKAQEQGLDKQPNFQEVMKFARLQLLAQGFTRRVQQNAGNISEADVEKYYKENSGQFEQLDLQRILIPKSKQHPPEAGGTAQPAKDNSEDVAAMKDVADKLHARAVSGEDFDKLQKEAFVAAGIPSSSPNVNLTKVRRRDLPVNHRNISDLPAGKISDVISDPGMFYIYKVVSKQMMSISQANAEIRNSIQAQRIEDSLESLVHSIKPEMNEAYFGPPKPSRGKTANQPGAATQPTTPVPSQETPKH